MRSYSPATAAALASRAGLVAHVLVWASAKNRDTGAVEQIGFWTGDDHQDFTIDAEARSYFGAGGMLEIAPLVMQAGIVVRMQRLVLSPLAPEVAQLFRGYDARLAPVQIHRALFDPDTRDLVDTPHLLFRGWIDAASIVTPEAGGAAQIEVTLAGAARALTRSLPGKRSDEAQQRRAGDRFRRHVDVSGAVEVWWGARRAAATPPVRAQREDDD